MSGILRDKTMDNGVIYIPNGDEKNTEKILVEKFGHYYFFVKKCSIEVP